MKLSLLAVGHIRGTDEAALFDTYAKRITQSGRQLGLDGLHVTEIKDQKTAPAKLSAVLETTHGLVIALDERGKMLDSPAFAEKLGTWRDDGTREVIFVLGPADGLSDAVRARADLLMALGPMTWPHMLARVLLSEQIWRAISILGGHPYHRAS